MLKGQDILCISSIDWDFIWQGHQEIMSRFAANGNRVLFIENTGVRAPTFRDLPRLRHRIANWWNSARGFRQVRDNLFVYSPLALPLPYSRLARLINRTLLLRALRRWMRVMGAAPPIVWTFLPTPLALDLVEGIDPDVTVYYCIDSFAESSPRARQIAKSEETMLRRADLVFVTSERLRSRAATCNPNVRFFPFGVDFESFDGVRRSQDGLPEDLKGLPRPLAGYVGGLHKWVDQALLCDAAARHPGWSFVLVGPEQTDLSALRTHPNIHLLGARSHADVPRYIKAFDVGMIPYVLTGYTHHVYPTKLNEYLAMGKPVVSTDLDEVRHFHSLHVGSVRIAKDSEDFSRHLEQAVREDHDEQRSRRIGLAQRNGWQNRVEEMSRLISDQLVLKQGARATHWQESLLAFYRTVQRRIVAVIATAATVYLLVFHTPLIWVAGDPLLIADPPGRADAIVVLAGGVGESGEAGEGYQERVKQAVELYQADYAAHIIFSSGVAYTFREPDVMHALAVSLGVPSEAITLETKAGGTVGSARNVSAVLRDRGWQSILLVSSPYNMRRASLAFRKVDPMLQIIHAPVLRSRFYSHGSGATAIQVRGILHEYAGIAYYWLTGKI